MLEFSRGPFWPNVRPSWSLWTPRIDSGGPDGSPKRELGTLAETHFPIMFVRSAKGGPFFAISTLINWLVRVCITGHVLIKKLPNIAESHFLTLDACWGSTFLPTEKSKIWIFRKSFTLLAKTRKQWHPQNSRILRTSRKSLIDDSLSSNWPPWDPGLVEIS